MSGVKGRSGRRQAFVSRTNFDLLQWTLSALAKYSTDENVPLEKRLAAVQPYVLKAMPEKLSINSQAKLSEEERISIARLLIDSAIGS